MDHVIVTRFCINQGVNWIKDRMLLFSKYYVQSLYYQTYKKFKVILLIDEKCPLRYANSGVKLLTDVGIDAMCFKIDLSDKKYWGKFDPQQIIAAVDYVRENDTCVVTRMDNDDSLSLDFMENLHESCSEFDGVTSVVDLIRGSIYQDGEYYSVLYRGNMFISIVSKESKNIYEDSHTSMITLYPTIVNDKRISWLHVKHSGSASKKTKHRLNKIMTNEEKKSFPWLFSSKNC